VEHGTDSSIVLVILGAALLAGYAAHVLGARTAVPRVTLLLILGAVCGPTALDIVPAAASAWFPLIAQFALAVVGFLLGEEFIAKKSRHNRSVLGWATLMTLVTSVAVGVATYIMGAPLELALVLGGVATATAPAATLDTIREAKAGGPLTDRVLGIVAADDVLGVIAFGILLAVAEAISGVGSPTHEALRASWEILGAVAIGLVLGFPMAWLTGRLRHGEPAVLEALGFVLLTAGVASLLGASLILACMVLGGTVAWRAKHHTRAVHEIEGVGAPLLAVFFLFAGFALELGALSNIGVIAIAYVLSRVGGRLLAGFVGGWFTKESQMGRSLGWCLLPQAGVAIGLALHAAERFPAIGDELLSLVITATVFFELLGPVLLRWNLRRAGELGKEHQ
jgi:Kef-type K+ transport system membrane component KefB